MSPDEHEHEHDHDHDDLTRASFEGQTGLFAREDSPFAQQRSAPLSWLEPLERDMVVLDVACGASHLSEEIAPSVRQVVGVDLTPALLKLGADRLRQAGVTNVLLMEGHATGLPFVDDSFDLVVSRSALHHIPDTQKAVEEMRRVCRPGGRLAVSDMVAPDAAVRPRFDDLHRLIDPSHAGVLLEDELVELLFGPTAAPPTQLNKRQFALPLDVFLTDVADHDAVMSVLNDEMDGGPATGFAPAMESDRLMVSFRSVMLQVAVA